MLAVCGAYVPSTTYQTSGGLSGTAVITAPLVITSGGEIMSSLSIADSINIPALISQYGTLVILPNHTLPASAVAEILNSLSGMDSETTVCEISNCLVMTKTEQVLNEISTETVNTTAITNTIGDYAVNSSLEISAPLYQGGHSKSCKIALPMSTGKLVTDSLNVYADGSDVTKLLKSAEIFLFGDKRQMQVNAVFYPCLETAASLKIKINEEEYYFEVTESTLSKEGLKLTGFIPDRYSNIEPTVCKASAICGEKSDIIFAADDFVTSDIEGFLTQHELAKMLAEISGQFARQMNTGYSMLYRADGAEYSPEIISISREQKKINSSAVVSYGKNGDNYITIEPEHKKTAESSLIKVYSPVKADLRAEGGSLTLVSSRVKETITESVIFENGEGRLSKPSVRVLTAGFKTDGKKVYTKSDCISTDITYETKYDLYSISKENKESATLCAFAENSVSIINGKNMKSISAINICDRVTALKSAKANAVKDEQILKLEAIHSNIINTTSGIKAKTPMGKGLITAAVIKIENNPVKITDVLEVLTWQR